MSECVNNFSCQCRVIFLISNIIINHCIRQNYSDRIKYFFTENHNFKLFKIMFFFFHYFLSILMKNVIFDL